MDTLAKGNGPRVAVVGAGAAGFFAAIECASQGATVELLEASQSPLAKVRISGGGRCNVTHACFEPRELAKRYPRGGRELIGPLSRFGPADTVAWFKERGVELKTEQDGRMFPVSDNSATIVDCLMNEARRVGVSLRTRCAVGSIKRVPGGGFDLETADGRVGRFDRVLLATGGAKSGAASAIAEGLGHTVLPAVPSLFTFNVSDPRLTGIEGLAVALAAASVKETALCQTGPVLVTHWGLSGPAILRLSAWGARELAERDYRFTLVVNWAEPRNADTVRRAIEAERAAHPKRRVCAHPLEGIPLRLWERLAERSGIGPEGTWAHVSREAMKALVGEVTACEFRVEGKSTNKEEFVTCGGVRLSEVDMATMESRKCPGLFFAGEILDIDGITGGFNFQSAWTTGWQAGRAMARPTELQA